MPECGDGCSCWKLLSRYDFVCVYDMTKMQTNKRLKRTLFMRTQTHKSLKRTLFIRTQTHKRFKRTLFIRTQTHKRFKRTPFIETLAVILVKDFYDRISYRNKLPRRAAELKMLDILKPTCFS